MGKQKDQVFAPEWRILFRRAAAPPERRGPRVHGRETIRPLEVSALKIGKRALNAY